MYLVAGIGDALRMRVLVPLPNVGFERSVDAAGFSVEPLRWRSCLFCVSAALGSASSSEVPSPVMRGFEAPLPGRDGFVGVESVLLDGLVSDADESPADDAGPEGSAEATAHPHAVITAAPTPRVTAMPPIRRAAEAWLAVDGTTFAPLSWPSG